MEINFTDILIEINIFSFKKIYLKMSSGKLRPSCLGLNVLTDVCGFTVAIKSPIYHVLQWPPFNAPFPQAGSELSVMYWWKQWLHFNTGFQCVFEYISQGKMEPGLKFVNPVIAFDFFFQNNYHKI